MIKQADPQCDVSDMLAEIVERTEVMDNNRNAIWRLCDRLHDEAGLKECVPGVYEYGDFIVTVDSGWDGLGSYRYKVARKVALPVMLTLTDQR